MPLILTSRTPWRRRPSGLVEIDRSSPQARGLAVLAHATQSQLRVLAHTPFSATGATSIIGESWDDNGIGWRPIDGGSNGGYYTASSVLSMPASGWTLSAWVYLHTFYAAGAVIKIGNGSTGYGLGLGDTAWASGGTTHYVVGLLENVSWLSSGASAPLFELCHLAMVGTSGGGGQIYLNGRSVYSFGSTAIAPSGEITILGANGVNNRHVVGATVLDARAYTVPKSTAEVWHLYAPDTRWSLYAPIVRRMYFDLGGAGGPSDLVCDAGAYTVTGFDATLTRSRLLTCDAGSYTLTGRDATLTRARVLTADAGSYALTGHDATLTRARVLSTDAGSYSLTGSDASLTVAHVLSADAGSYSLTGLDATLTAGSALVCDAGGYTVTGYDATLTWARQLTTDTGSYTLSGQDATLTKVSAGTLACDTGTYALTGYDATLTWARLLSADAGAYSLTGYAAGISYSGEIVQVADPERTWRAAPRDTTWRARPRDTTWRGRRR